LPVLLNFRVWLAQVVGLNSGRFNDFYRVRANAEVVVSKNDVHARDFYKYLVLLTISSGIKKPQQAVVFL